MVDQDLEYGVCNKRNKNVVEVRPRLTTKHNRSSKLEWLSDAGEALGVDLVGNWAGIFALALVRR